LAELEIHDNSAKLVSMRIGAFITFSFSTSCSKINPGSAYSFRNFQSNASCTTTTTALLDYWEDQSVRKAFETAT
jgi:hypothetical protein